MLSQRKVPIVETHLEDTFKAILDKHMDIGLVAFIYSLSTAAHRPVHVAPHKSHFV